MDCKLVLHIMKSILFNVMIHARLFVCVHTFFFLKRTRHIFPRLDFLSFLFMILNSELFELFLFADFYKQPHQSLFAKKNVAI